jgi:tRNA modification GTPase
MTNPPAWIIRNKIDLVPSSAGVPADAPKLAPSAVVAAPSPPKSKVVVSKVSIDKNELLFRNEHKFISISALAGSGVEDLLANLEAYVKRFFGSESGLITRERHRHGLQETVAALDRALNRGSGQEEIVAEELRLASRALGRLTGKVDVEDILDVIFRDFCIGK